MALLDQLEIDIKAAMKAKNADKLRALRGLKTALQLKQNERANVVLTSDDEVQTIQKALKTRRESADIYAAQKREDLVKIETDEIAVLESYLPKQLTPAEVEVIVKQAIADTGSTNLKDMGKVMAATKEVIAGRSDNKTVSDLVRNLLTGV